MICDASVIEPEVNNSRVLVSLNVASIANNYGAAFLITVKLPFTSWRSVGFDILPTD
jgi:hypothetical protein